MTDHAFVAAFRRRLLIREFAAISPWRAFWVGAFASAICVIAAIAALLGV